MTFTSGTKAGMHAGSSTILSRRSQTSKPIGLARARVHLARFQTMEPGRRQIRAVGVRRALSRNSLHPLVVAAAAVVTSSPMLASSSALKVADFPTRGPSHSRSKENLMVVTPRSREASSWLILHKRFILHKKVYPSSMRNLRQM